MPTATFKIAVGNAANRVDNGRSEPADILYTVKMNGIRVVAHLKSEILTLTEYTTGYFLAHLPDNISPEVLPAVVNEKLEELIRTHGIDRIEQLITQVGAVRNREEDLPAEWRNAGAAVAPVAEQETTDDPELAEMLGIPYVPAEPEPDVTGEGELDPDEFEF